MKHSKEFESTGSHKSSQLSLRRCRGGGLVRDRITWINRADTVKWLDIMHVAEPTPNRFTAIAIADLTYLTRRRCRVPRWIVQRALIVTVARRNASPRDWSVALSQSKWIYRWRFHVQIWVIVKIIFLLMIATSEAVYLSTQKTQIDLFPFLHTHTYYFIANFRSHDVSQCHWAIYW